MSEAGAYVKLPGAGQSLLFASRPEEDAREGIEVRARVLEARQQALAVDREEALVELGREPAFVVRERRPAHPLDDVVARVEPVAVDLETTSR